MTRDPIAPEAVPATPFATALATALATPLATALVTALMMSLAVALPVSVAAQAASDAAPVSGTDAAASQVPDTIPVPTGNSTVLGQVVSAESGEPVRSASVELLFISDTLRVGTTLTDPEGRFLLEDMPEGLFFVRLSSLGYGTAFTEGFEVAAAERRNLGELAMSTQVVELEPIVVSAERTIVTYEADRTSYNVGVMPGTEGASVTATLSRIPELEVDIDGRITLRNRAVAVYIDDREAPMSGEALALFLEQFPADYLQSIEIIENPPARYDAEGSGGIVNLVTREGVELGMSGSVFVNTGTRGQHGLGGRGTLQRGDWTVNGGGFARLQDSKSTGFDLRQNLFVDPEFLRQDSWSERSGLSSNADFDIEFEPGDRFELFLEGSVSGSGQDSRGLTTTTHLDDPESPILAYDRFRSSDGRDLSFEIASGFELQWGESEQELELDVELQRGRERENSRDEITEETGIGEDDELIPSELTLEDENQLETELALDLDYSREWEEWELELGYQAEWSESDDVNLVRFIDGEEDAVVSDRGHDEQQTEHSVYTTVRRDIGELSVQVGLRAEQVRLDFALPGLS